MARLPALTNKQDQYVGYLVRDGLNRTEAARRAGFKWPKQAAHELDQNPKIIAKIRQERNKIYQTELAPRAVRTLKTIMADPEAPASARVAAARTSLELAGDIGKHSQANRNQDRNLAEMTPDELAAFIGHWEGERAKMAKDITPPSKLEGEEIEDAELVTPG
ncbi:MAG: terminase small subunit [SAR324 cluster bacterium]|jgi:hypothetical protein|nr:terminase small subunit [SAR324 cluster bacterium]